MNAMGGNLAFCLHTEITDEGKMLSLTQLIKAPGRNGFLHKQDDRNSPKHITRTVLSELTQGQAFQNINVRLWDGSMWPNNHPRAATVVLNRPSALREMLLAGSETGVGEAYLRSAFDVEGDMEAAFELADQIMERTNGWTKKLEMSHLLKRLPDCPRSIADHRAYGQLNGNRHSLERDRKAISFHYNVSNDFYALWLDKRMAYSCAYFKNPAEDLETAQQNKFDLICRKLGLRPGQRLLDIGCGWGGLIFHAVQHYGVQADGITLSEQQLWHAQQAVLERGLDRQITLHLRDYRELPEEAAYDAISSVGMVEHVGREKLSDYFGKTWRLLKPGGLFLNHGIGLGPIPFPGQSGSFIQDYVFPDSDLVRIGDMLKPAENEGWEIRDVESLREHYVLTLRNWVRRLEKNHDQALSFVDEPTYRIWRLYMAGCAHNFQVGRLSIYQTLLAKIAKNGTSRAPVVRGNWYQ
jgi:cyclopropane-fatty-acyl-phospholipid synthase